MGPDIIKFGDSLLKKTSNFAESRGLWEDAANKRMIEHTATLPPHSYRTRQLRAAPEL